MKNLELNPEFSLLGQINFDSVKMALDRDEMEEVVGGSAPRISAQVHQQEGGGGSGGARAVDWACVGVGVLGVATGIVSFGTGALVAVTLAGSFCTGWGAGRMLF